MMRILNVHRRPNGIYLYLVILTFVVLYRTFDLSTFFQSKSEHHFLESPTTSTIRVPIEYLEESEQHKLCSGWFGLDYLYSFAKTAATYTTSASSGQMTCLYRENVAERRNDSFCIIGPAELAMRDTELYMNEELRNQSQPFFELDCELKEQPTLGDSPVPQVIQFPSYMYNTGPGALLYSNIDMSMMEKTIVAGENDPVAILVRREGATNLWHCMQELFALYATVDILRMSKDPATGEPLLSEDDAAKAHVVILDDLEDGPYFDLWDAVAQGPVLRGHDIEPGTRFKRVILPLPGAASPFWQGNWDTFPCDHSELLSTFSRRITQHFFGKTPTASPSRDPSKPLVITYSERTEKRRLINKDENLAQLRTKFSNLTEIRRIDFSTLTLPEQIQIIKSTDILVGVHGAGLTHSMFLPPDSVVVEIIPQDMPVQVYRNLAKLGGHQYFGCHAKMMPEGDEPGDWYSTDLWLEEDKFLGLMEVAVKSAFNSGLRNLDIVEPPLKEVQKQEKEEKGQEVYEKYGVEIGDDGEDDNQQQMKR